MLANRFPLFLFPPIFVILSVMLFSPRISTRELAQLCRRLSISVDAGIDARTMWAKEAQRAKGQIRSRLEIISQASTRAKACATL